MMKVPGSFRTVLAAASLLVLGAAAGVTVDRVLHSHTSFATAAGQFDHDEALNLLEARVALRPGQRERILAILDARQPAIDSAWHDAQRHINATVGNVVNEIAEILDPDQIEAFHALVNELHGSVRLHPIAH